MDGSQQKAKRFGKRMTAIERKGREIPELQNLILATLVTLTPVPYADAQSYTT